MSSVRVTYVFNKLAREAGASRNDMIVPGDDMRTRVKNSLQQAIQSSGIEEALHALRTVASLPALSDKPSAQDLGDSKMRIG